MKTMKWKFYSLAFVAGMSILTACSSDFDSSRKN